MKHTHTPGSNSSSSPSPSRRSPSESTEKLKCKRKCVKTQHLNLMCSFHPCTQHGYTSYDCNESTLEKKRKIMVSSEIWENWNALSVHGYNHLNDDDVTDCRHHATHFTLQKITRTHELSHSLSLSSAVSFSFIRNFQTIYSCHSL